MNQVFQAIPIADHIYWVGAIDWSIRDFHGYSTHRGTTYNAYLILDDTITLIDTVRANFKDEMLSRIRSLIDPASIHTIVSNHAEMDHTGSLPAVIDLVRPKRLLASPKGASALREHFHWDLEFQQVKSLEAIPIGRHTLQFLETTMLHWPDSMVTYIPQNKLLFSQDAFGMHLASCERFSDELPTAVLEFEARKYYANILWPYSGLINTLFKKIASLGLNFDTIAPDHGPVWRTANPAILEWYMKWAGEPVNPKVLVIYDTMWHSTQKMAESIAEGLRDAGVAHKVLSLSGSHRSDIATELIECSALIAGSPTLNNNVFPTLADVMVYLKGLKPKIKAAAVFGSYGWSGESIGHLKEYFNAMKIPVIGEVKARYVPDETVLKACFDLGTAMASHLKGDTR